MNFASLAVERPVATTMLIGVLVVLGMFAYKDIPVDLFPRVEMPYITIVTMYAGASPSEVENLITDPIEEAVSSIAGIENLSSNSLEGVSQVLIEFDMAVDQDTAAQDVREKVDMILADLPDAAERPKILKLDINATAVVEVAVFGDRPVGPLTRYVEDEVKDALSQAPGVADVELLGSREREIRILLDEERMTAYDLSVLRLSQILAEKSVEIPGGRLIKGDREWTVRVAAKFASVQDIAGIEIPLANGTVIQLSDLADIRDTFEDERQRAFYNGRPAVILAVKKRSDANAPQVAAAVREAIAELTPRLPDDVRLAIVKDRSVFTLDSLNEVSSNLQVGIILTSLILLLFLRSIRTTFIAALAMPASIIATMLLVKLAGFTLNMLTTMALAITVGILVNNAIVVLENITRKVDAGMKPSEAAVLGTNEIAVAVAGATLTNVVVFVPIAFMGSIVGQFFYSFGLTATFSTLISLLISFTVTPMLAALIVRPSGNGDGTAVDDGWGAWFERWYRGWEDEYRNDLPYLLDHPYLVIGFCCALMLVPFMLRKNLGFEFMAQADQGEFIVKLRRPAGVSLESTTAVCRQVEDAIYRVVPEITHLATRVGKIDSLLGASEGVELGQVTGYLKHKTERERGAREIVDAVRAELAAIPGAVFSVEIPGIIGSSGPPLQVEILGPKLDDVVVCSAKVQNIVESTEGAVDTDTTWRAGRPEFELRPDRIRCERAGVSMAYLARSIRGRYAGLTPVTYREGSDEFDVRLLLAADQRNDPSRVADLTVVLPSGTSVPIAALGEVVPSVGPSTIIRKDRKKAVVISGYVKGRSFGTVLNDIQAGVAALDATPGVHVRYEGEAKRMRESFGELRQAFILAILLTYMLLAGLLESFVLPVLILVSLPLAFVGIIPALIICDMNIAMFALMAVVMLVGIVVNNGILLVEVFRDHRDRGESLHDAVVHGAPERLRPILMTTIAAALAMVPLAMGQGSGGEMRAPMAVVSIGGLLASMILSLFLIPLLYYLWERRGEPAAPAAAAAVLVAGLLLAGATPAVAEPMSMDDFLALPEEAHSMAFTESSTSPGALSLTDCVRRALEQNHLIRASLAVVAASRQDERVARAAKFGSLAANVSRIRYNDDMKVFSGNDAATSKNLVLDLPLFTGGAITAGERKARADRTVSEQSEEQTRQSVVQDLVQTYYGLLRAQWLVALGQEHVKSLELQLELVDARVAAGAATPSERLRVEVALAEARERLIRFENIRRRAAAALNLTMAEQVEEPRVAVDPKILRNPTEVPRLAFVRVRTRHPELQRVLAEVAAKRQDLKRAQATLWPSVGLNVTYGDANALFVGEGDSTQIVVAANVPLYKGGSMRAAVQAARERLAQARELAQFTERRIRFDIVQAHLDVDEAWKRIEVTRQALLSAAENARITSERYRTGAAIVLELVDAQVSLLGTRMAVLEALVDHALARVRYYKACGDVWQFFPATAELPRK